MGKEFTRGDFLQILRLQETIGEVFLRIINGESIERQKEALHELRTSLDYFELGLDDIPAFERFGVTKIAYDLEKIYEENNLNEEVLSWDNDKLFEAIKRYNFGEFSEDGETLKSLFGSYYNPENDKFSNVRYEVKFDRGIPFIILSDGTRRYLRLVYYEFRPTNKVSVFGVSKAWNFKNWEQLFPDQLDWGLFATEEELKKRFI